MSDSVAISHGEKIVADLVTVVTDNKAWLSEIDGAIGDGDHGINMAKGFALCGEQINDKSLSLAAAFDVLSDCLMEGIGGSMGPLYGSIFLGMAGSVRDKSALSAADFVAMLRAGLTEVSEISSAQVGDKCLMDSLVPAVQAGEQALQAGADFATMLRAVKLAAECGRDSTVDLVAKVGRASRLGERSRGVADAGATSCCLLICTLADSVAQRLPSGLS